MKKFPEIEKIVGKTGSSEIPTDPMPIDASDMMIILKPRPNGLGTFLRRTFRKNVCRTVEKHVGRNLFFSISSCYAF
jgi:Cu/Ag efflux pump CusA